MAAGSKANIKVTVTPDRYADAGQYPIRILADGGEGHQATADLLGGHVKVGLPGITIVIPHAKAGRLVPLAITSARREVPAASIAARSRPARITSPAYRREGKRFVRCRVLVAEHSRNQPRHGVDHHVGRRLAAGQGVQETPRQVPHIDVVEGLADDGIILVGPGAQRREEGRSAQGDHLANHHPVEGLRLLHHHLLLLTE